MAEKAGGHRLAVDERDDYFFQWWIQNSWKEQRDIGLD